MSVSKKIKQYSKSRTVVINTMIIMIGYLEANISLVKTHLGDNYGYVFMGIGLVGIWLRAITTKPLDDK